ncbi:MAG: hypothetical protein WAW11_02055 [Patescibacteria group bacterium]
MINFEIKKEALGLAAKLHNKWRQSRKVIEGLAIDGQPKREERFKPIDPQNPDGPQIDIANTPFKDLPAAWQNENYLSAEVVMDDISKLTEPAILNLETESEKIHNAWKGRHPEATGEQADEYDKLSIEEKDKDRLVVEEAVEDVNEEGYEIKLDK